MKKLIIIAVLAFVTTISFAQQKTTKEKSISSFKWQETKDGISFQMEVNASGIAREDANKPFFSLNIKGNKTLLTEITLVNKEKPSLSTPILIENQKIMAQPGFYTFSFYHVKFGKLDFEIQLKNEDVILDLTM